MSASPSPVDPQTESVSDLGAMLHSRGYIGLLLVASLVGIPISAIAFGFLAAVHALEDVVWHDLPADLGFHEPPLWWPVLALGLAGLLVALAVTRLPGHGGHVPANGLAGGATPPGQLPGVALAAAASLVLGAVVGPEAPLIAMGSGLAVLAVTWLKAPDRAVAVIAAAGSAAAIAAIFGNPSLLRSCCWRWSGSHAGRRCCCCCRVCSPAAWELWCSRGWGIGPVSGSVPWRSRTSSSLISSPRTWCGRCPWRRSSPWRPGPCSSGDGGPRAWPRPTPRRSPSPPG